MPVFDFSGAEDKKAPSECTYTTYQSSETNPSPDRPILVLDNSRRAWSQAVYKRQPVFLLINTPEPWRASRILREASMRIASRSVVRLTSKSFTSSASLGSLSPSFSS